MLEKCFECIYWDGDPKEPERIELCKLHKIVMRGCRDACHQYVPREDLKVIADED